MSVPQGGSVCTSSKMKGLLLVVLLSFTVYQGVTAQAGRACGCGVRHPQVRYCTADFAALVQINGKVETDLPFVEPNQYGIKGYVKYNISITEVFKPKELEVQLVTEDYTDLWSSLASDFCGKTDLEILEDYVISGDIDYVTNPETGEEHMILVIDTCDIYSKMDDTTSYQMHALTAKYALYCDSECQPNEVLGGIRHDEIGVIDAKLLPAEALTDFWTLDIGCFYNPAASMPSIVGDCEGKFSVCKNDTATQQCTWDLNPEFLECFEERGRGVSYLYSPNAAAVRKPSDCKYLPSKKLKKKCLRKLKKIYKQQLQG